MKKRKLGKNGINVSAMGMGCWAIGGPFLHWKHGVLAYGQVDDKVSITSVKLALEKGITLFDTAVAYGCGHSERVLGEALKGHRDDVVIATKFSTVFDFESGNPKIPCRVTGTDVSPEGVRDACDASLERLQTDYIDVFQLHSGSLEPELAPPIVETLENLVEEGKIRSYGWSTDSPERAAVFAEGRHCSTVQFRHNMFTQNYIMISDVIDRYGISGLIKTPLGGGLLTGKYSNDSTLPEDHMLHGKNFGEGRILAVRQGLEKLREILTNDGRTLAQAALGWIWTEHDRLIPIPGFKSPQQVEENTGAMEFGPLSKKIANDVKKTMDEMLQNT